MKLSKTLFGLVVALLLGNAIILFGNSEWLWLRLPVVIALIFVLPGWTWLPLFRWMNTRNGIERIVLLGVVSSLLVALVLLFAVMLPGPFTESVVLWAINLVVIVGLLAQTVVLMRKEPQLTGSIKWPARRVLLIFLAIVGVAVFTRFFRLGYAEFHEDSLENMRLIVRAYKGEEYAPFLDSKGPIHWLLPAATWFLNGWLTEGIARTSIAISSLLLVPMVFILGQRMTRRDSVALVAAGFVAVNGFFVAYARLIENQSLIIFWGTAALWLAYRYSRELNPVFLFWTALALGIGLIAHPDVLLYLPLFAFVIGATVWRERKKWRKYLVPILAALMLFVGVAAIFYVPYLTDPNIGFVKQYFAEDRIGQSLLYNRVENLFDQDELYSSRYHAPLLVFLLVWLLVRKFAHWRVPGYILVGLLLVAIGSTIIWPHIWMVGGLNLAFLPYALLTLAALFLPSTEFEFKILFLWLMTPLGALLFLAKDAADHIQIAYPAWTLLAGLAVVDIWDCLTMTARPVRRILKPALVGILALFAGLILYYQYLVFLNTVTNYWQVKLDYTNNPDSIYGWLYGSIPRPRKIFSNPRFGGWKAVGYLLETGKLHGDFRSINESFAVPIWYTFQTPRSCYEDPQNYWVRRDEDGWPSEEARLPELGYQLTRVVLVDDQPSLHLYELGASVSDPEVLDVEAFRRSFDLLGTPARFAQDERVAQPASINFGDRLLLYGFNLPPAVSPGERLPVTLFWMALSPMDVRYRAFVHLIGPDGTVLGQHDDDPACRLLTTDMRPGQESSRQFRILVDPETPPGLYEIRVGVYHPETFERLPIWDNQSQNSPGDSLVLGEVRVE